MAAAAHHSRHLRRPGQPGPGGPLALRRIPPGTWTVRPRLDILTQAQRRALRHLTGAAILDDDQARVLPAGQSGTYADLRAQPGWAAAETELQETGLFYSINGPDEVHVGDDVKNSASATATTATSPASSASPLRWTRPEHIRPEVPRPGRVPASEHPGRAGSHSPARAGPGSGQAGFGPGSGRRPVAVEGRRLT